MSWMFSLREPEGQVARWLELLGTFDLKIEHRRGVSHLNADSLSRRPCGQCQRIEDRCNGKESSEEEFLIHDGTGNTCAAITREQRRQQVADHQGNQAWLEGWEPVELREAQLNDEDIGDLMQALEEKQALPKWQEVSA
mgnify:CR=1 FL=1